MKRILDHRLRFQILPVASDSRDRGYFAARAKSDGAIPSLQITRDGDLVALTGMADISNPEIIVITPEKRDGIEAFAAAKDVPCCRLTLPLRDDPVLDSNPLAGIWVRPARDI